MHVSDREVIFMQSPPLNNGKIVFIVCDVINNEEAINKLRYDWND